MRNTKHLIIWAVILLSCLLMFTFADDVAKVVQAIESNARITYNGREVALTAKPFSIEGYNYLSVRSLAELFGKNIDWNQAERKIIISDKPDATLESLKAELAAKDKNVTELQDKVKKLENDTITSTRPGLAELQEEINNTMGEYEDVDYKVILSGNEDEIRVKIEVDFGRDKTSWGRLGSKGKKGLVDEIYNAISLEYDHAKVKGYIVDITSSDQQMIFHYNWAGEIDVTRYRNFSTISTLEDRLNADYSGFIKGIHFSIGLGGNENRIEYTLNIQEELFSDEWEDMPDTTLKSFMKKLCSEINKEFPNCHVIGYVYDTGSGIELAYCEQIPDEEFKFERSQ